VEILLEILFAVLEVVGELLLQVFAEALFEFGLQCLGEVFRRPKTLHPVPAAIGYAMLGATAGAISLTVLPHRLIGTAWLRIVNLVVTPLIAGAVMAAIGAWRRKRDQELIRLDRFAYGYVFALAMAVVRIVWGH
jgi:hypothetical protein